MKKLNKVLGIMLIGLMIGFTSNAFACEGYECLVNGTGSYIINSTALGSGFDADYEAINSGSGFGVSSALGNTSANARGNIVNGTVDGTVNTTGGGVVNTTASSATLVRGMGVGSRSDATGITAGVLDVNVNPGLCGNGSTSGNIIGSTSEMTSDRSWLVLPGNLYTSDSFTDGYASQSGRGYFSGGASARAGSDTAGTPGVDSKAGAGLTAGITITGFSYSESYRQAVDLMSGTTKIGTTEVMGTNIGAETDVSSYGTTYEYNTGRGSYADADLRGSYNVCGGVASHTVQTLGMNIGTSNAAGNYTGDSNHLNTNYTGSAIGTIYTAISTIDGMKGAIVQSGATMTVTSIGAHNVVPN